MKNLFAGIRITSEKVIQASKQKVVRVQNGYQKVRIRAAKLNKRRQTGKEQIIVPSEIKHKCKNCKAFFSGKYCFNCGQSANTTRLSWRSVIDSFFGGITNIASGFGFTIIELFTRPGYMMNDFVRGKRVIYAKPFSLLFVLAALYALSAQFIYPPTPQSVKERTEKHIIADSLNISILQGVNISIKNVDRSLKDTVSKETKENDFEKIINVFEKFIDKFKINHPYITVTSQIIYNSFTTNQALSAILILPFITLGMRQAFRKSKKNPRFNYVEMLFINSYLSCQGLIVSLVLLPFSKNTTIVHIIFSILLYLWTLKELFGNSKRGTIFRYLLTYLNMGLIFLLVILLLAGLFALFVWITFPLAQQIFTEK